MSGEAQAIGPYRLLELLGCGSMSAVYRAEHLRSGRLVALKAVQAPWAALPPLIRREIHALGRLRHPGVVQILDSGTHKGLPWYAMELLEGPTLREQARRLELRRPEELLEPLGVVRRLCEALAYVHGEGIVHRDLKPDNVLLRPDGRPVLVDFGFLAEWPAALGRESLAADALQAGTPLYLAPELLRGRMADARADLYSLGCVLYELLAGRPPFEGSAAEVCQAQLHAQARPLSELAPWVPAKLEALVLRLLAKEPRKRLGYATDVAAALGALGAHDGSEESRPQPRAYLYRPGFVGRAQTLQALEGHLARAEAGQFGVVLIGGESGVGKTRLLMELELRARARGIRVLTGECLPGQVGSREPGVGGEARHTRASVPPSLPSSLPPFWPSPLASLAAARAARLRWPRPQLLWRPCASRCGRLGTCAASRAAPRRSGFSANTAGCWPDTSPRCWSWQALRRRPSLRSFQPRRRGCGSSNRLPRASRPLRGESPCCWPWTTCTGPTS
jgi:hypothetical protein